jgi:hypothetical protein
MSSAAAAKKKASVNTRKRAAAAAAAAIADGDDFAAAARVVAPRLADTEVSAIVILAPPHVSAIRHPADGTLLITMLNNLSELLIDTHGQAWRKLCAAHGSASVKHLMWFLALKVWVPPAADAMQLWPSPRVDAAWRSLLLMPRVYRDVCGALQPGCLVDREADADAAVVSDAAEADRISVGDWVLRARRLVDTRYLVDHVFVTRHSLTDSAVWAEEEEEEGLNEMLGLASAMASELASVSESGSFASTVASIEAKSAAVAAAAAAAASASPAEPSSHINVIVIAQNGNEQYFKMRTSTPFSKLMVAYCQRTGASIDRVRFIFATDSRNSCRLRPDQTPADVGMEDDVVIDAMVSQEGC